MTLELVPQEILVSILSYCTTKDTIQILRVNKKFQSLRHNHFLWTALLWEKYKIQVNSCKGNAK